MATYSPPYPGPDATWQQKVLHACSTGDIKAFELLMDEHDEKEELNFRFEHLLSDMLGSAVRWQKPAMLRHLMDRFPQYAQYPTDRSGTKWSLREAHDNAFMFPGGLPMYLILLERWPELSTWDLGERGDHLGKAAMNEDLPFVEWLLQHGEDAKMARWIAGSPVSCDCTAANNPEYAKLILFAQIMNLLCSPTFRFSGQREHDRRKIIRLLRDHGATEGDRIDY